MCVVETMSVALCTVSVQRLASCCQDHVAAVAVSAVANAAPLADGVVFDAADAAFAGEGVGEVADMLDAAVVSAVVALAVGAVEFVWPQQSDHVSNIVVATG